MRGIAALAVLAMPAALVAEPPPPAFPEGLYSNVRMSEQTGDLGGLEVRFYRDGARNMAEFALCEGWCNEVHVSEVRRGERGFVFGFTQSFTGAQGDVPVKIRFIVWPVGRALNYSYYQGNENIDPDGRPRLMRRVSKPFGIAVAKSGKE